MSDFSYAESRAGDFTTSRRGEIDALDRAFIRKRISAGQPLASIAKMIQRPVAELEAIFDPPSRPAFRLSPLPVREVRKPNSYGVSASFHTTCKLLTWSIPKRSMATILKEVAHKHGLTVAQLKGPRRSREIAHARQEAMWRTYETGDYSLPQIGRFLGNRDHTTILHGIRAHQKRMGVNNPDCHSAGEPGTTAESTT